MAVIAPKWCQRRTLSRVPWPKQLKAIPDSLEYVLTVKGGNKSRKQPLLEPRFDAETPDLQIVLGGCALPSKDRPPVKLEHLYFYVLAVYVTVHEKIDHNAGIMYFYLAPGMLSMTLSALKLEPQFLP